MIRILLTIGLNIIAISALNNFLSGFEVLNRDALLMFALIISALNYLIVPIIKFLAFPLNLITLGLVGTLINISVIYFSVEWVDGVNIIATGTDWYIHILLISVVTSFVSSLLK